MDVQCRLRQGETRSVPERTRTLLVSREDAAGLVRSTSMAMNNSASGLEC